MLGHSTSIALARPIVKQLLPTQLPVGFEDLRGVDEQECVLCVRIVLCPVRSR